MELGLRLGVVAGLGAVIGCVGCVGCAAGGANHTTGGGGGGGGGTAGGATTSVGTTSGTGGAGGVELDAGSGGGPAEGEVFGHSDTSLFKLEPIAKKVTLIGNFDCVSITLPGSGEGMWDIALDKGGQMYGTSATLQGFMLGGALVKIDKATAHCTVVAQGTYPNSLTFVPAGTLDPTDEALAGYKQADYVRIDPTTGAQSVVGSLNPNPTGMSWESSGDVVSIIGDKTYLTVKPLGSGSGYSGTDHIVEVDPKTGQALKIIGDTGYPKLWGLGYWGGTAYGFGATGQLCAIDLKTGSGAGIPLMNVPPGLAFWGAGVTTAAPITPPN